MWIVAVAWIYVVGLMAVTETSVVAGIMTFLFYCVLPLTILFYLTGGKRRAAKRQAAAARTALADSGPDAPPSQSSQRNDGDGKHDSDGDSDGDGGSD